MFKLIAKGLKGLSGLTFVVAATILGNAGVAITKEVVAIVTIYLLATVFFYLAAEVFTSLTKYKRKKYKAKKKKKK